MSSLSPSKPFVRRRAIVGPIAALGLALTLAACQIDDGAGEQAANLDYHKRYPIVLAEAPAALDVFTADGQLDEQSLGTIRAFVERYHRFGAGKMVVLAPSNRRNGVAVVEIRKALYADGLRGQVEVGSYPNPNGSEAAPVRLLYEGIVAKVPAACGNFPDDLGSGDNYHEWQNEPYHNFGCSNQKMFAAQIDDPRDLARARAPGDSDAQMRLRAIEAVRSGSDPGTTWKIQNTNIGSVGGS